MKSHEGCAGTSGCHIKLLQHITDDQLNVCGPIVVQGFDIKMFDRGQSLTITSRFSEVVVCWLVTYAVILLE